MYDANISVAVARIRKMISISETCELDPSFLVTSVLCILMDEIDWEADNPEKLLLVLTNIFVNHGNT